MAEDSVFQHSSMASLIRRLDSGEMRISDLADVCLVRIEKYNSRYKAFVSHDPEQLRRVAAEADQCLAVNGRLRLLEGMPLGVEDIFNTIAYPTQMGSELWQNFMSGNDARAVFNCLRQGALVAGKTVTAEFAVHHLPLPPTINPYDPARTPGASSSGSAVAVALGLIPAAIGTQSAGSIVRPASYCGIYGFKPSFGLIPRTGMLKTTDTLDSVGLFAFWAEDLSLMLRSLQVVGPDYPISHRALSDENRQAAPKGRPWRLALVKTHTWNEAHVYARQNLLALAGKISRLPGFEVIEVNEPKEIEAAHRVHETIYDKSLSYYFSGEAQQAGSISPLMEQLIERGRLISSERYRQALRQQELMASAMDDFFSDYDAAISLATAGSAPLRDQAETDDPALIWTMTYLPSICAPAFKCPEGLPFGVQILGRRYNDYKLLRLLDALCCQNILPAASSTAPASL